MMTFRPLALLALLVLSGCVSAPPHIPEPKLTPVRFADLSGWTQDQIEEARPALTASCARLVTLPDDRSLGANRTMGTVGDWKPFCKNLNGQRDLRRYLEASLQPWALSDGNNPQGLFTGYHESELNGSLTRHGRYQTPLYRKPPNFVSGAPELERAAIVNGSLAGRGLELVWLDDPIAAFFVQVQGSGRVKLDNGKTLRIGFDGKNGYAYTAIGRELVARGEMTLDQVSLQSIRAWLETHPAQQNEIMNLNQSYVFFRPMEGEGTPEGAAHVPLTPQRSLAVDNAYVGYHVPVWLQTDAPAMQRLVVAQDTGGAIKGIVRGDFFWGCSPTAEQQAGLMRSTGRYFVLLPKAFRP